MIWLWILACRTDITYDGTLVGNAGSGKGKLAISQDYDCTESMIPVEQLSFLDVNGDVLDSQMYTETNLLTDGVDVASGDYSSIEMNLATWNLDCQGPNGSVFFAFDAMQLAFEVQSPMTAGAYIFLLGDSNWLESPHPEERLQTNSTMWFDVDQDGEVNPDVDSMVGRTADEHSESPEDHEDDTGDEEEHDTADIDEDDD